MRQISLNTAHGRDHYLLLDSSEIVPTAEKYHDVMQSRLGHEVSSWQGDSISSFMRRAQLGDETLVAESEKFLAEIEDQIPVSRGWRNVDDVVGAVPNVPSFLAGHPQHMRRRERASRENAPLAIYMDLTSSAGISAKNVMRRGVVLLALTRMLVEHRAVSLWVGASLGNRGRAATVAWQIDTAPMDLARAAYHVSATAMSRAFGYGLCQNLFQSGGAWPFSNYDLHVRTAPNRLRSVMDFSEIMYIPGIFLNDPMTRDPVGWLKRVMKQYVKGDEE